MPSTSGGTRNWNILRIIGGYMMLLLLWRVFVPAHEYSMRTEQVLDIVINIGLIVGVVGTFKALSNDFAPDDSRWATAKLFYWGGLSAGIVMLLIRFTSNAAWWTGHLRYSLD